MSSPDSPAPPIMSANSRWTLNEAMERLASDPDDAYVQYVAVQLSHRQGTAEQVLRSMEQRPARAQSGAQANAAARGTLDLLSLFSGAAAVQECLQLEAMRSNFGAAAGNFDTTPASRRVSIDSLQGPTVNSHPWDEMLANASAEPHVSALSCKAPAEFLFAESRSALRLLDSVKMLCSWGDVVSQQFSKKARAKNVVEMICRQLMLPDPQSLIKSKDTSLQNIESAVVSSDLFLSEGSDLSIFFRAPDQADESERKRLADWLNERIDCSADLQESKHVYLGCNYVEYSTPCRRVSAFVAELEPGLHLRSNSRAAFQRIIQVHTGQSDKGPSGEGLGSSSEFAYIRTLMPELHGTDEVCIYFSDPFIRRLVGAELRVTEQRRLSCFTRMKMLEYAVLLYRTEHGSNPSLADLERKACSPGRFNEGNLSCPEGGTYSLLTQQEAPTAFCSQHGRCAFMTPCIDTPVAFASEAEQKTYTDFVENYSRYWQTFFDPIAMKITHDRIKKTQSIDTIILPLIQNSVYSGLAAALAGLEPLNLEEKIVPAGNIFSAALMFNKSSLISLAARDPRTMYAGIFGAQLPGVDFESFFLKGLGDHFSFNVFDSEPPFSLDISQMLATLMASMARPQSSGQPQMNPFFLWIGFMLGAINSPIYLAMPVHDRSAVDRFMQELDAGLPKLISANRFATGSELYSFTLPGGQRGTCLSLSLLAAKFRIYWTRIADTFYVASKQSILMEICNSLHLPEKLDAIEYSQTEVYGHAMLRIRNANWKKILSDVAVGQAELNRKACLENLAPLEQRARAGLSIPAARSVDSLSAMPGTESWFCPDAGRYSFDGRAVSCSVHGTTQRPTQAPAGTSSEAISKLRAMTAQLSFLEDGLHGKLIFDLKE